MRGPSVLFRDKEEGMNGSLALFMGGIIYIDRDWYFALPKFKRFFVLLHEHLHWLNSIIFPGWTGLDFIDKIIDLCILERIIFGIPEFIRISCQTVIE